MTEREFFGSWSVGERGPVEGRLTIDESGQIDLQLRGFLNEAARGSGQLADGSPVTLFGMSLTHRDPDADFREQYRIGSAVLGVDVEIGERCFSTANRRLGGLEEVIGTSGLSLEIPAETRKQRRSAKVEWEGSSPVEVRLPNGTLSLIDFARFDHESDYRYALAHIAEAKLTAEEALDLDSLEEIFDVLSAFVAFAIEARIELGPLSVKKVEEVSHGQGEVLTRHRPSYGSPAGSVEPWLTLRDLKNPEEVVAGFYRFAREQASAYLILFELQVFIAALNPIDKLLYLARFLEVYHRTRFPGPRDPDEVHAARESLVKRVLEEEHKAWGAHILHHSNEVFFKERVVNLLEDQAAVAQPVIGGSPTDFAKVVGDCRNYWTHYAPELQSKVLRDVELDQLNDRVLLMVRACILDEIGVSKADAGGALERDWRWRHYAGVPLQFDRR